jgi:predicted RNA methylase
MAALSNEQVDKIVEESFTYFREKHGFPYEELTPLQLWYSFFCLVNKQSKIIKSDKGFFKHLSIEIDGTGTSIADYFHSHIFESHAINMSSAIYSFNNDVRLKKAIRLVFEQKMPITTKSVQRMLRLVNGTQICANFRPIGAKGIYHRYVVDGAGDILDPSTGYGGRLLGYMSNCFGHTKYIGVDPNTKTHKANKKMASFFGYSKSVELYNSPFEDWQYTDKRFQLAFTSPPYFKKEIYSTEDTQSCNRYTEYQDWIRLFWEPAIQKVKHLLLDNGYFIINIQDIKINSKKYPLTNDTQELMHKNGFELVEKINMLFPGFGKSLTKRKTEPTFVFKKKKEKASANSSTKPTSTRPRKRKRRSRIKRTSGTK